MPRCLGREMFGPKDERWTQQIRKERHSSVRCLLRPTPFDLMKTHIFTKSLASSLTAFSLATLPALSPCTSDAREHGGREFGERSFDSHSDGHGMERESRSFAGGDNAHLAARSHIQERFAQLNDRLSNSKFAEDHSRREQFDRVRRRLLFFLDFGTPVWLVDSWADALCQDEILDGMPSDLVLDCWGDPLFVESTIWNGRPAEMWTFHPRSERTMKVTVFNHRVADVRRVS
jgi:hypothetical protein